MTTTYLINLLTTGLPYDTEHTIYAELLDDDKFHPQSLAVVVKAGEAPPTRYNPFVPFATGVTLRDTMREQLWMDFDPDTDPVEYHDQELNYPDNHSFFEPEFMRDACMAMIRECNGPLRMAA